MSNIQLWKASHVDKIPQDVEAIEEIIPYSDETNLTQSQKKQIIGAFNAKAYDMAAEYVWRKAITKLKEAIMNLGNEFICELLQRSDTNSDLQIDSLLTDYNTINLAEQLGMISREGALDLRQSFETLQFYFSSEASREGSNLGKLKVLNIIQTCVQNILSKPNMQVALEFSHLRDKLLKEDIKENDIEISQLRLSSLFFLRTVCTVLSSAIRTKQGAVLEHSVNNFKVIIPIIWSKLTDDDKWKIGFLYRDVVSDGNTKAANGVKVALAKNGGFDFVPENLRSQTFIKAAQILIDKHFEYDNYYKEPRAIKELASLGTVIPEPAMMQCMKAYVLVYVGNNYGRSNAAIDIAEEQLASISSEQWIQFFDKMLPYDQELLSTFCASSMKPIVNFYNLLKTLKKNTLRMDTSYGQQLYRAILLKNISIYKLYLNKSGL